ncbi:hypothetical protein STEG23_021091, partial [Scotinomys teguina]
KELARSFNVPEVDVKVANEPGPQLQWNSTALVLSSSVNKQYQTLLLANPQIWFEEPTTINPATLLPIDNPKVLFHDCQEMKDETSLESSDEVEVERISEPEYE